MSRRRRELLQGFGAVGLGGLAGCGDTFSGPADEFDENGTEAEEAENDGGDGDQNEGDGPTTDEPDGEDDATESGDEENETDGESDSTDSSDDADETVSEPDQSLLTLTVVGPAGEPVADAAVVGEGRPHDADIPLTFSGTTDSDGQYTDEIYENTYAIEVDHSDYETTSVEHAHDGEREVRVELESDERGADSALLTLSVVDPSGEPIEGAEVVGEGEPRDADIPLTFDGETDASGEYTDVIYENEYSIEVDHPDYGTATVEHTHDGERELTIELDADERTSDGPNWPMHGANPGNTRAVTTDDGFAAPDTVAWQYENAGHNFVAADGAVYLQTEGEVHALNAEDGSVEWTSDDIGAGGTPAVDSGGVYVGGQQVTALKASTGDVRWTKAFDAADGVSTLIAFETVYAVADGTLYALDPSDGSVRWEADSVTVEPSGPGSGPKAFGGSVVATSEALCALIERESSEIDPPTEIGMLDPTTGEILSKNNIGRFGGPLSVSEDKIFVQNMLDGLLEIYDGTSLEIENRVSGYESVATVDDTVVHVGRGALYVTELPTDDYDSKWSEVPMHAHGDPAIVDDVIFVPYSVDSQMAEDGEPKDQIRGYDIEDGTVKWQFTFDDVLWHGDTIGTDLVVSGDTVYVRRGGSLTAIRPSRDEGDGENGGGEDGL